MTTGSRDGDARGLDDGRVIKVATLLREATSGGFGDNWMGIEHARPFYSASREPHLCNHSQVIIVNNAALTTLRIKVRARDSTPYVMPRLVTIRVHIRLDPATAGPSA